MNETIIITTNAKKEKILREIATNKQLENLRFMTEKKLKEQLYFSYDESAILYLMKQENIKYQVAKTFIEKSELSNSSTIWNWSINNTRVNKKHHKSL